jgi:hypothetical protein
MVKKKKDGTNYELINREIFDAILNRKDVNTIAVKHDKKLRGLKTSHQIDVFWKFKLGDIEYTTIVQAKDWDQLVSKGEMLKFKAVLDDIPNQPRGVFVTSTGYQPGALEVAKASGIQVYTLKSKANKGPALIRGSFTFTNSNRETKDIRVIHDDKWLKAELARLGLPTPTPHNTKVYLKEINFYDAGGMPIANLQEIINNNYPKKARNVKERRVVHKFKSPTFLKSGVAKLPFFKVLGLEFTISAKKEVWRVPLVSTAIVEFILENVNDGTVQKFDNRFNPLT